MRILVTGGSGMVGKSLKKILPNADYFSSKDLNLLDEDSVKSHMELKKYDTVIHLAAKVGGIIDNINKPEEYFIENIQMNTNILKWSRLTNVKRFIGILSTCIYPDKVNKYPMEENIIHKGPPAPTNFSYGYAKRCLAVHIDACNKQYNTQYQYLIPCNLYSEYDNFSNNNKMHFITALLNKIKKSKGTINLVGTGKPLRQFMYAGDFAKIIKEVINNNILESFNVSPNYNYSIDEMVKIALKCVGKRYNVSYSNPELDGQYRKDVSSKIFKKYFSNFKFTNFEDGIIKVYDKIS